MDRNFEIRFMISFFAEMPAVTATTKISREEREQIGIKCKRILDVARIHYLNGIGFTASLKYFVSSDVTPENVCLIGVVNIQQ